MRDITITEFDIIHISVLICLNVYRAHVSILGAPKDGSVHPTSDMQKAGIFWFWMSAPDLTVRLFNPVIKKVY
jgi:hypothetical protein